jgi:hypothetical protein
VPSDSGRYQNQWRQCESILSSGFAWPCLRGS